MSPSKRFRRLSAAVRMAAAAALLAALSVPAAADSTVWHYRIGEPTPQRQVNSCSDRAEVQRLARIFDQRGPRPGYAALSDSPLCRLAPLAFTPRQRLMSVPVYEDGVLMYTVHFMRVETRAGATAYVVTTRRVEGD